MIRKSNLSSGATAQTRRRNPGPAVLALVVLALMLVACADDDGQGTPAGAAAEQSGGGALSEEAAVSAGEGFDDWLQRLRRGEIPAERREVSFEWGRGYLVHYAPIETLGVDNLIYNALTVHRRLATGEIAAGSMSQNERNLLDLTEGIEFNPDVELTELVAQTLEIREAILGRIVASQRGLSPAEALDANEVVGVVALHSPEDLGGKYLVFTQESPDSDFAFLGVAVVADATTQPPVAAETYSFGGWQELPLLGDASGPFWNDLPPGVSGDPANTDEGRPGVLLVSQQTYEAIAAGELE